MTVQDFSVYTNLNALTPRPFAYVFGVVIHCEQYKGSAGEVNQRILLTDPSLDFHQYMQFIIKYGCERYPPNLKKFDIVRLRRVTINQNSSSDNLCGYARIDTGGFSMSIWNGSNVGFDEDDVARVNQLIAWCSTQRRKYEILSVDTSPTISSFSFGTYLTIIAQIIAVCLLNDGCIAIRVWDGTKAVCSLSNVDFNKKIKIFLSRNEYLEIVAANFAVDVVVYDEHIQSAKSLKSGNFVKLKNVHAYAIGRSSSAKLVLHGGGCKYGRGIEIIAVSNDSPICLRINNRIIAGYPTYLLPKRFQ